MRILVTLIILGALLMLSPSRAFATQSNAKCQPSSGTYQVGDIFAVDIVFDTRSFPIYGADIVGTYGSTIIQAQVSQITPITTVTNWTAPTTNTVGNGNFRMDYGKSQAEYTGSTSVGQITFKALKAGQAKFDYTFYQQYDDTTADGGAIKIWGKKDLVNISNILTDVNGCTYVIEEGVVPTSPPGATSAPVPTELPRSGTTEMTVSLLGIAGLFLIIGTVLPAISSRKN
jgi:hypothetical protein